MHVIVNVETQMSYAVS